jgi:hypothetical protein
MLKQFTELPLVDIEAEDLELGNIEQGCLAFDVDGEPDEDLDALDSDDDRLADDKSLGIDTDESDGEVAVLVTLGI